MPHIARLKRSLRGLPLLVAALLITGLLAGCSGSVLLSPIPTAEPDPLADLAPLLESSAGVTLGRLPNGLQYAIQHNPEPRQRVELRLVVNAGSTVETERQLGFAHFVEHLVFAGTRRFPGRAGLDFLESTGMQFGPEVNAYTGFDDTRYLLTLPTEREDVLATGVRLLADWAGGATFVPDEVESSRSVILEELRGRRENAAGRLSGSVSTLLLEGSRYAERDPGGLESTIRTAGADELRAWYRLWYRPDLIKLVIVGDVDVASVETLVRAEFGALTNPPHPAVYPASALPARSATRFAVVTDPESAVTQVSIIYALPSGPFTRVEDFRDGLVSALVDRLFNARLAETARQSDAPFSFASAVWSDLVRGYNVYDIAAAVEEDGIEAGLAGLLREAERAHRYGFTASELERGKLEVLATFKETYSPENTVTSGSLADLYVDHFLDGGVLVDQGAQYSLGTRLLPRVTLEEVNAAARDLASPADRLVLVVAPAKAGLHLPSEADLASIVASSLAEETFPYVDTAAGLALMRELPEPGRVISSTEASPLAVTQLTLSNGARVFLRPSRAVANQVLFSAISPGGLSQVSETDYPVARAAARIVAQSGAGELDQDQLLKLLAGKSLQIEPFISDYHEGMQGGAATADVEALLQMVHLYATGPRADAAAVDSYLRETATLLENRALEPAAVLEDTLFEALCGASIRCNPWRAYAKADERSLGRAIDLYRERFSGFDDFAFIFVGDFDPDALVPLIERYIGSLPSRGRPEVSNQVLPRPPEGIIELPLNHGVGEIGVVHLTVAAPYSPSIREGVRLVALERLLDLTTSRLLREQATGTYTPLVWVYTDEAPRPGYQIHIEFSTSPERTAELAQRTLALITDLRENGPGLADAATVREQLLQGYRAEIEQNDYWRDVLEEFALNPSADPAEWLDYERRVRDLDAEELQSAVATYLPAGRYILATLLPSDVQPTPARPTVARSR